MKPLGLTDDWRVRMEQTRRQFLRTGMAASALLTSGAEPSTELTGLTLQEASERVRKKTVSPVELTEACLRRIERLNPKLNAFITVTTEDALSQARKAENEIHHGRWRGPLHGIPLGIKDNIDIAGVKTTEACAVFLDRVAAEDAEIVRRLKVAGAVLLGKHNMHEAAYGVTGAISHFGPVRNPWALDRITGGSSSGSAAAVSAGLGFGAVATDGGGSIRRPSAYCGVVGLKPTYGLVSIRGGGGWWSVNHLGPIGRTVADTALILQQIVGHDPQESTSVQSPSQDYAAALTMKSRFRVGVPRKVFYDNLDADIERALDAALEVIRALTAGLKDVRLPPMPRLTVLRAEAFAMHAAHFEKTPELYKPVTRGYFQEDSKRTVATYIRDRREQDQLRRNTAPLFPEVDLLVTPSVVIPPPSIEDALKSVSTPFLTRNLGQFNTYGVSAMSVPCGFSRDGLPIGLQVIGKPFQEAQILALAYAYEQATDWHMRRPPLGV